MYRGNRVSGFDSTTDIDGHVILERGPRSQSQEGIQGFRTPGEAELGETDPTFRCLQHFGNRITGPLTASALGEYVDRLISSSKGTT